MKIADQNESIPIMPEMVYSRGNTVIAKFPDFRIKMRFTCWKVFSGKL